MSEEPDTKPIIVPVDQKERQDLINTIENEVTIGKSSKDQLKDLINKSDPVPVNCWDEFKIEWHSDYIYGELTLDYQIYHDVYFREYKQDINKEKVIKLRKKLTYKNFDESISNIMMKFRGEYSIDIDQDLFRHNRLTICKPGHIYIINPSISSFKNYELIQNWEDYQIVY